MTIYTPEAEASADLSGTTGLPYAAVSATAIELLRHDIEDHGITDALSLPEQRSTPLGLYKEGWYGGVEFDDYAYIAAKLITAASGHIPAHPEETKEAKASKDIKGLYGNLGASILLRCIQKGAAVYLESTDFPDKKPKECADILRTSYDSVVTVFANAHNSIGSRLEILYGLSDRGRVRYPDYAQSVEKRYKFELVPSNPPVVVPQDILHAQLDAGQYPELEPEIPQHTKGICPLNAPATQRHNPEGQRALHTLWNIAVQACEETPWMFPEKIDQITKNS